MSWNAYLIDDRGHVEGEWNYTHNTNKMANEALGITIETNNVLAEIVLDKQFESWWKWLNGMSGKDGRALLSAIIEAFEADPLRFKAMNPGNGWGDFHDFKRCLTNMRDAVPEWPTEWKVNG